MGLARDDWKLTGKRLRDWAYPTKDMFQDNETGMKRMVEGLTTGTISEENNG